MSEKTVNIHDAKAQPSRVVAPVEWGERMANPRAGKPVTELQPARKVSNSSSPLDNPRLCVDEYNYDGPVGPTGNKDIDRTIYGI